jgi:hypothetical protein
LRNTLQVLYIRDSSSIASAGVGGRGFTVTINDSVPVLPASSVALHCTSVYFTPGCGKAEDNGSAKVIE